jgi:hypothetical protein
MPDVRSFAGHLTPEVFIPMCEQFRFEWVFNPAEGLATVIGRLNQRSANGKQETLKCAQFRFGRILAEGLATQ